jgi:hypothetical protein
MKIGVSISIDVTKILKDRLYQGKKGTYLDLTTFIDTNEADQYDNHGFISQSLTKEEREEGAERTPILGNCKVFYTEDSQAKAKAHSQGIVEVNKALNTSTFAEDDIPF